MHNVRKGVNSKQGALVAGAADAVGGGNAHLHALRQVHQRCVQIVARVPQHRLAPKPKKSSVGLQDLFCFLSNMQGTCIWTFGPRRKAAEVQQVGNSLVFDAHNDPGTKQRQYVSRDANSSPLRPGAARPEPSGAPKRGRPLPATHPGLPGVKTRTYRRSDTLTTRLADCRRASSCHSSWLTADSVTSRLIRDAQVSHLLHERSRMIKVSLHTSNA